eukprot:TRINITY_DN9944_c0_g2_i1.p1 TRINITY_DN9944_c0_g2~~TRINITY_DN9944_c0_g2_i1.p1  ORF type:complete len:533 (+),score=214.05 TRINITY_DN9944_c0_g2_i1:84-1601(+)
MADSQGMSASAKRRARAKAAAERAGEEAAPAPAPAPPAPKAKAKAAAGGSGYPEAKAKAKAKAEPAKAAAPAPEAQPKAKAKAKAAQQAPAPKAAPAPAPAPEAKAKAKAEGKKEKAKAKPAPKVEEPVVVEKPADKEWEYELDDGSGPAWDVATGLTKKQQKREDRKKEEAAAAKLVPKAVGDKYIPGLSPVPGQHIPGMGPAPAKGSVSQSVNATGAVAAAAAKAAAEAAAKAAAEGLSAPTHSATVHVPENKIGIVIGPKGSKIQLIQEKTGAKINTDGEDFTIMGDPQAVAQAEAAIKDLVTKGYTNLAFEDFAENVVMVHDTSFPDLIGKQGAVVIAMKKELNVEVSFPDTKGAKATGKRHKVTIAGATKNVEKAKEVINDILMYGHHEVTHPGDVHEEMEVPEWCYAALIGKKGSELKHIQNSFHVKVNIPRETSLNQNVVVVGDAMGVKRAKAHIEKALYNFQNQVKGRDRNEGGAEDPWGAEEPMEDWMKQYMYKRN